MKYKFYHSSRIFIKEIDIPDNNQTWTLIINEVKVKFVKMFDQVTKEYDYVFDSIIGNVK